MENTFYDFAKNVFPKLLAEHAINAFEVKEYWSDIGTIAQYIQSMHDLFDEKCYFKHAPIVKQNTGAYISENTSKIDASVKFKGNSTIGKNCIIGKNCEIENCIIWDNVEIADGVKLSECVIASNCVIQTDLTNQIVGANEIIATRAVEI